MYEYQEKEALKKSAIGKGSLPYSPAQKQKNSDPYSGIPLPVSLMLAARIRDSFGIKADELSLRESPEVSRMGARATAQGNVIRFAPGEYNPDSSEGLKLLGHELNHVREQALGHVQAQNGTIYHNAAHEARSNEAGLAFASGLLSNATSADLGFISANSAPMQRYGLNNEVQNSNASGNNREEPKTENTVTSNVYINAPFNIFGPQADTAISSTTYRALFLKGVEEWWTGQFGTRNVTTTARENSGGIKVNVIAGNGTSHVNYPGKFLWWGGWSPSNPGSITMDIMSRSGSGAKKTADDFKWTSAHEFGHILGLTSETNSGNYGTAMMGVRGQPVDQSIIEDVIKASRTKTPIYN